MESFRLFFCRNSIDCHSHVGRWFSSQYLYRSIPFESRCCAFTSNTRTSEQHFIWGVIKIHALLCAKHYFLRSLAIETAIISQKSFFGQKQIRNNNRTARIILGRASHFAFYLVVFFLEQERARHDISSKQNDTARWCAKHYGTFRISWVLAAMMAFWRPRDLIKFGNCFSLIVTEWMQKNIMGVN